MDEPVSEWSYPDDDEQKPRSQLSAQSSIKESDPNQSENLGDREGLNVLFFNCSGWRVSRTHIDKVLYDYSIAVHALNEHWWMGDLNRADGGEANLPASRTFREG